MTVIESHLRQCEDTTEALSIFIRNTNVPRLLQALLAVDIGNAIQEEKLKKYGQ